jgi:hypothetical protein
MLERKLKIIKRTPIALASCERCHVEFQCYERVEDEAERDMRAFFDGHRCEDKNTAAKTRAGKQV